MKRQIHIVEVGPRDGLRNDPANLTVDEKLEFIARLEAAGVTRMESGSFVSPKAVPGPAWANESSRPSADSTESRTRPLMTRYNSRPGSPREKINWPLSNVSRRISLASAARAAASSLNYSPRL